MPSIERCGAMPDAVARAAALARPGDTVLLSPACASFDQYRNFEERGRHFADARRASGVRQAGPPATEGVPMARKLASDKVLFGALVALSLFGCVMIYSASAVSAGETSGNPYRFLLKQIAALVARRHRGVLRVPDGLSEARPALGRLRRLRRDAARRGLRALPSADQRRAPLDPSRRDDAAALGASEGRPRARRSRTSSRARARRRGARRRRSCRRSSSRSRPPASSCCSRTWAPPPAT